MPSAARRCARCGSKGALAFARNTRTHIAPARRERERLEKVNCSRSCTRCAHFWKYVRARREVGGGESCVDGAHTVCFTIAPRASAERRGRTPWFTMNQGSPMLGDAYAHRACTIVGRTITFWSRSPVYAQRVYKIARCTDIAPTPRRVSTVEKCAQRAVWYARCAYIVFSVSSSRSSKATVWQGMMEKCLRNLQDVNSTTRRRLFPPRRPENSKPR